MPFPYFVLIRPPSSCSPYLALYFQIFFLSLCGFRLVSTWKCFPRLSQRQIVRIVPSLWLLVVFRVSLLVMNHSSIRFVIKRFTGSRKSSWMIQEPSISNWSRATSDQNLFDRWQRIFFVKNGWIWNIQHIIFMESHWIIRNLYLKILIDIDTSKVLLVAILKRVPIRTILFVKWNNK